MTAFASPVVATSGSTDPSAPLVVLLHGRGSDEREIIGIADYLPDGPAYVAMRAPIISGPGYAWFANRGIGRPIAESLAETMGWFREWLDELAPSGRPVVLVGFSGGAAFAGGLILAEPARFAGAAILYGTLPFDAGVPVATARLAGLPVFVAQGDEDLVIPRELLDGTWSYLLNESGAPVYARRDPGGHGITSQTLGELAGWIRERLTFVASISLALDKQADGLSWPTLSGGELPKRSGSRPQVSWTIPQQQQSDNAPASMQADLFQRVKTLAGVSTGQSAISVPGARGFMLESADTKQRDAFLVPSVGEFAHLHPEYDGSVHVALPLTHATDAIAKGWAVAHPLAGIRLARGMVLFYGPRNEAEVDIVAGVIAVSHAHALYTGGPSVHRIP